MTLEPMISLADAARTAGVSRSTLRRWLRVDLNLVFPEGSRGRKLLVRRRDVERVLELHSGQPVPWNRPRGGAA